MFAEERGGPFFFGDTRGQKMPTPAIQLPPRRATPGLVHVAALLMLRDGAKTVAVHLNPPRRSITGWAAAGGAIWCAILTQAQCALRAVCGAVRTRVGRARGPGRVGRRRLAALGPQILSLMASGRRCSLRPTSCSSRRSTVARRRRRWSRCCLACGSSTGSRTPRRGAGGPVHRLDHRDACRAVRCENTLAVEEDDLCDLH